MISRIHNKLGTAGFIVAIVALVAALSGAAIAAGGLTGQQEKQVKKIAQKEAKKFPGPAGPAGPQGPAGPAGAAGAKGDTGAAGKDGEDGTDGKNGTNGTNGTNGNSVVVAAEPKGSNCEAGGVKVTVEKTAGQNYVCNGKDGEGGEGGGPLAPGQSLYGHWGYATGVLSYQAVPISFNPIYPEAAGPDYFFVTFEEVEEEEAPEECPGTVSNPVAEPGNLCIYQVKKIFANPSTEGESGNGFEPGTTDGMGGTDAYGVTVMFLAGEFNFSSGTWVVTAPEAP